MIVARLNSILWRNDHGKHFVMDFFFFINRFHIPVHHPSYQTKTGTRTFTALSRMTPRSAPPRVALLKAFKWSHVGVIFQEEDIHRTVTITHYSSPLNFLRFLLV